MPKLRGFEQTLVVISSLVEFSSLIGFLHANFHHGSEAQGQAQREGLTSHVCHRPRLVTQLILDTPEWWCIDLPVKTATNPPQNSVWNMVSQGVCLYTAVVFSFFSSSTRSFSSNPDV